MSDNSNHNPFLAPQAELHQEDGVQDSEFELNIFSAAGRIGRLRYLSYSMGLSILVMFTAAILAAVTTPFIIFLAYGVMIYCNIMLAIKRSHDFNVTGWASLLIFVPLANLALLLIPGTDGPNRYGNKTAPNGGSAVTIALVVIALFVIGILAAIAIPAYQEYTQRAHAAQQQQLMPQGR